jgi:ADP-ribosylglycohydrolase
MDPALVDRASGVLLGQACGDALGVPYEFGPALPPEVVPEMVGGGLGPFEPGEYSDDTAMATCIAEVSATGIDLTGAEAIDRIAGTFLVWGEDAKDIGNQTREVLAEARASVDPPGVSVPRAARAYASTHPHSAGNGALMRTAVVALSRVRDRESTAAAARTVAAITHPDPLAVDSCVVWTEAVRRAVLDGDLDLLAGLDLVAQERRASWQAGIDEATGTDPRTFNPNGFTVTAMQAAWAAITWTPIPDDEPTRHFELALMNAVRAGNDTDTVAAIAGGLLGARWGASAVPQRWTEAVHGYGGHTAASLVDLALDTLTNGTPAA